MTGHDHLLGDFISHRLLCVCEVNMCSFLREKGGYSLQLALCKTRRIYRCFAWENISIYLPTSHGGGEFDQPELTAHYQVGWRVRPRSLSSRLLAKR